MSFDAKRARVLAIYAERERLDREEAELLRALQADCAHESVIASEMGEDWSGGGGPAAVPPHRLCLICSFEETGAWTARVLKATPLQTEMPILEFCSYRRLRPLEATGSVLEPTAKTVRVPKEFAP